MTWAESLQNLSESGLVICYALTAPTRARLRGYDQARLIAMNVGRSLRLPVVDVLARQSAHRQVGATGAVRRQQLHRAFRVRHRLLVQNADVLLIDDVVTTGSTLEAAAKVLHAAGAQSIRAAVFAQAGAGENRYKLV